MSKFKSLFRTIGILTCGVLSLGSLFVGAGVAQAQTATPAASATATATEASSRGYFGTLTAKTDTSITIKTNKGDTLTLAVTADTKFRTSGDTTVTLSNLVVGSRLAIQTSADSKTALKVMVVPGEPQTEHRVLTVISVSGKTLTAQDADGNTVTVTLDQDATADMVGKLIVFVGDKDNSSATFHAKATVKLDQVILRLSDAEKKADKDRDDAAKASLRARLEANMGHHLDLMAQIIAKLPDADKAKLQADLDAFKKDYKTALAGIGDTDIDAKIEARMAEGAVSAVDATGKTLSVQTKSGATLALKTDSKTTFTGYNPAAIGSVAVGDKVGVRYNEDTMVALDVRLQVNANVTGTIVSVDTVANSLVIKLKDGSTLTLKLDANTVISLNDKKAAAGDLKANAQVRVEYNTKTLVANRVAADTIASIGGAVKSVTATSVVVTGSDGKDVTLTVNAATKVQIHGVLLGVLGLTAGMYVEARYDTTTGIAIDIMAKEVNSQRPSVAAGTVSAVDTTAGTITIATIDKGSLTLKTDSKTQIRIDDKDGTLASIAVGARVYAMYDADTMIAAKLTVGTKPVPPGPGGVKPDVSASGTVTSGAENKSDVRTLASGAGTVSAVDLVGGSITIVTGDKGTLTLKTDANTQIVVDGKAGLLSGIAVGARVDVLYSVDTKVAAKIMVIARSGLGL